MMPMMLFILYHEPIIDHSCCRYGCFFGTYVDDEYVDNHDYDDDAADDDT